MNNQIYAEPYRPAHHFSPAFGWINDPNGLVYQNGTWHLFYQYYPMDTVWGPMHWGHAISTNLVDWQHLPIALAPDELGYIFSGSAIVDENNTSGLFEGKSANNLVAFYTSSLNLPQLDMIDIQNQNLAYSQDGGLSWKKYAHNPVVKNKPFIPCFRDPKVNWHEASQHWIMVVTCGQSIGFFRSKNLIDWEKMSEFGADQGFHTQGPWECPDLFEMSLPSGEKKWVLVVGIGNGCFEGSSGTQYFVGDFNGEVFTNSSSPETVKWLDVGRDYYATQSWFNAPENRRVGISWFSNWQYARNTDTVAFRGAMTSPKEYRLEQQGNDYFVVQAFAPEVLQGLEYQAIEANSPAFSANAFYVKGRVNFAEQQTATLSLYDNELQILLHKTEQGVKAEFIRRYKGQDEIMQQTFPHHYQVNENFTEDCLDFELLVDNGLTEFHLGAGKLSVTQLAFPKNLKITPRFTGDWQDLSVAIIKS